MSFREMQSGMSCPIPSDAISSANSILAFEALCGRRLVVKDPEQVATFASETARQYEDDMMAVERAKERPVLCLVTDEGEV